MKNGAIILNVVLLVAVGILFYLHFRPEKTANLATKPSEKTPVLNMPSGKCAIAYFEMDSVEANFDMAKEWKNELEKKEDNINAQINRLQNLYREKYNSYQQRKVSMTNAQTEAATNELGQLEETIKNTKTNLDQDYKSYYVQTQQEILSLIRKFCTEYNKDKKFAIIISDEPGLVFYKDSTFDITNELLAGLNKMYQKAKIPKKNK